MVHRLFPIMQQAQSALIEALDAGNSEEISAASERLRDLCIELKSLGSLRSSNENKALLEAIARLNKAAETRLRYLRDQNQQRLNMLNGHNGQGIYSSGAGKP